MTNCADPIQTVPQHIHQCKTWAFIARACYILTVSESGPSKAVVNVYVFICFFSISQEAGPSKSNKRLIIGVVSGITLVVIVVAAVLAAVFIGAKVTKDSQKVR